MTTTIHWANDNAERITLINCVIGWGKPLCKKLVDRGHKNGSEYHCLTSTGLIVIYNARTQQPITVLIARPGQLLRYFGKHPVPNYLMKLALEHEQKGYNRV